MDDLDWRLAIGVTFTGAIVRLRAADWQGRWLTRRLGEGRGVIAFACLADYPHDVLWDRRMTPDRWDVWHSLAACCVVLALGLGCGPPHLPDASTGDTGTETGDGDDLAPDVQVAPDMPQEPSDGDGDACDGIACDVPCIVRCTELVLACVDGVCR